MKKITVYSKPNCMQCDFTKKHLDRMGLEYQSVDVTTDQEALDKVQQMGFHGLQVVVADGMAPFVGYRPDELDKLGEGK
nr:MAG TPA: glutaredoxin-like protein [Caudoviricetes sp.]